MLFILISNGFSLFRFISVLFENVAVNWKRNTESYLVGR